MPPVSSRTNTRSTPRTTSAFNVVESARAGCTATGRRLAYTPSSLRSRSRPVSGRSFASGADHFGQPIAMVVDGYAAEIPFRQRELMSEKLRHLLQRAHAFACDFRTNAIAPEDG